MPSRDSENIFLAFHAIEHSFSQWKSIDVQEKFLNYFYNPEAYLDLLISIVLVLHTLHYIYYISVCTLFQHTKF